MINPRKYYYRVEVKGSLTDYEWKKYEIFPSLEEAKKIAKELFNKYENTETRIIRLEYAETFICEYTPPSA